MLVGCTPYFKDYLKYSDYVHFHQIHGIWSISMSVPKRIN